MKIWPVLDLLDGVVVRGVAGRRDEYRPVQSTLAASADAQTVARAIRQKLGLDEFYVADLDAILHDKPNNTLYRALVDDGLKLMIDAGLRSLGRAREVLASGAAAIIAGLETSAGPQQVHELCHEFGAERVIFSLDLQAGKPMGKLSPWKARAPFDIAMAAVEAGVRRLIVLDLAQVGVGQGLSTIELCRRLIKTSPNLEVITGGGVRHADDLKALASAGIHGVLVASALHDGRISRSDVAQFS